MSNVRVLYAQASVPSDKVAIFGWVNNMFDKINRTVVAEIR